MRAHSDSDLWSTPPTGASRSVGGAGTSEANGVTAGPPPQRELVSLDHRRCITLLGSRPVGRLVFTHRALPEVLPVNYRVDGDAVVLRVARDSVAASACRDTVVAFQVDRFDEERGTGWSVTVVGRSSEITDPAERARVLQLPLTSWLEGERDHLISISMDRITGREIVWSTPPPSA